MKLNLFIIFLTSILTSGSVFSQPNLVSYEYGVKDGARYLFKTPLFEVDFVDYKDGKGSSGSGSFVIPNATEKGGSRSFAGSGIGDDLALREYNKGMEKDRAEIEEFLAKNCESSNLKPEHIVKIRRMCDSKKFNLKHFMNPRKPNEGIITGGTVAPNFYQEVIDGSLRLIIGNYEIKITQAGTKLILLDRSFDLTKGRVLIKVKDQKIVSQ